MANIAGKDTAVTYDGTAILGIQSVQLPRKNLSTQDATEITSAVEMRDAEITSWGPAMVTAFLRPDDPGQVKLFAAAEVEKEVEITLSDGSTYTGDCFVTVTEPNEVNRRNRATLRCEFTPVGAWVFVPFVAP